MNLAWIGSGLGWQEIVLILVVVVLLFGAKRIPEIARSLGRSMNEFKKGREEGASDKPENAPPPKKDQ